MWNLICLTGMIWSSEFLLHRNIFKLEGSDPFSWMPGLHQVSTTTSLVVASDYIENHGRRQDFQRGVEFNLIGHLPGTDVENQVGGVHGSLCAKHLA